MSAPPDRPTANGLQRRLGVAGAVVIGLASMVGAGVFFVWAPAAAAAGDLLLVSLAIAAVVATLNALATTQLAMANPVAGGVYAFGRVTVGPWTGFAAGWLFVWGKTASAAAIAVVAGAYLWPELARPLSVVVVIALAIVNMTGIRSTAVVSAVVVAIVLGGLGVALVAGTRGTVLHLGAPVVVEVAPLGVLQGAAIIFFAFAGYARMATLGEEVRRPRRTLPLAIVVALGAALAVYALVASVALSRLGAGALSVSTSPIASLIDPEWDAPIRLLAGIACLGSLAGILAGLSRTSLAMARERDLPGPLARVSTRTSAPVVAEAVIAVLAAVAAATLEPALLVALSSCAVLGYYAIAHVSALKQAAEHRWLPRALNVVGAASCASLALALPIEAVAATAVVLGVGLLNRWARVRRSAAGSHPAD